MNEEELKKGCGKEAGFITFTDDFGNKDEDVMLCGDTTKKINGEIELFLCDTCQARLEYFQKGKLKAIEDELRFLREIEKGTSCIDTKMFLKLRIEQLQKEIKVSGDSLTEFWDNSEDDRWDKEEEKQDDN